MQIKVYFYLSKEGEELSYHLNNILQPKKCGFFGSNIYYMSLDDYSFSYEAIKSLESDLFVEIPLFIDELGLDNNLLEYAFNFLKTKSAKAYRIVDIIEDLVLSNSKTALKAFRKHFETKLSKEVIETGLGLLKYGNSLKASKELYIHRNTLIYRIDTIKKYTTLDLKNFNDQLAFYGLFH